MSIGHGFKNRLVFLDILRGLAVIGMVIFHFFFILNFFGIQMFDINSGGWLILARAVQFTFLGLVGFSLAISRKNYPQQLLRAAKISVAALSVTLITYYLIPDFYVRFGILHFIAVSIILLAPFARQKYLALAIVIISLPIYFLLSKIDSENLFMIILGSNSDFAFNTIDHFSIFPWITVVACGMFLGRIIKVPNWKFPSFTWPLVFLGRHSLLFYLLHVPAIIILLIALDLLPLSVLL